MFVTTYYLLQTQVERLLIPLFDFGLQAFPLLETPDEECWSGLPGLLPVPGLGDVTLIIGNSNNSADDNSTPLDSKVSPFWKLQMRIAGQDCLDYFQSLD